MSSLTAQRAFLFLTDRHCYVVLVTDGKVVETIEGKNGRWRLDGKGLGLFSVAGWLNNSATYDSDMRAWWVGKKRTAELVNELDGRGFSTDGPWPHNDPLNPARSPDLLDTLLILLSAVSPGRREKLAKGIAAAVHPDGDERKSRTAADELSYLMSDVLQFVRSNADQPMLWALLLRQGWSVPTPPASVPGQTVTGNSRDSAAASPPPPSDDAAGRWVRECEQCGRTFNSVRNDARYHSDACRQAAYRARK